MGFREDLEQETVKDLPIRKAVVVRAEMSVRETVQEMRAGSLGCAVVVDGQGRPQSIFTEQALLDLLNKQGSIDGHQVAELAETQFLCVQRSEPIRTVWNAVSKDGARFICVVDDEGKLVGLTGQRGLAEYISEYFPEQVMVQRLGSKPWMQQREGA